MRKLLLILYFLPIFSFAQKPTVWNLIEQTRKKYAPDKRIAIFNIELDSIRLVGKTNIPAAKKELLNRLKSNGYDLQDGIRVLPDSEIGERSFGFVNVSVANIRKEPKEQAEMVTQAFLGTYLKVFDKERYWFQVQTPDNYIGWVEGMTIYRMNKKESDKYDKTLKIIYMKPYGFSYTDSLQSATISDLTWGDLLMVNNVLNDYYEVLYPDNRKAFILKNEAIYYDDWLENLSISQEKLVKTAQQMTGLPYLWGGTSWKGVDCSGFTRMIYQMNGLLIPRDASQQVYSGDLVDTSKGFEEMKIGDLLFFGEKSTTEKPERIVHVGMWIGNSRFIHSSGMVKISSFDKESPLYDAVNANRYIRTKRILGSKNGVIDLKSKRSID
jgi:gamma-D-glutamyl-L-lysine dipeptidyl-peptidase